MSRASQRAKARKAKRQRKRNTSNTKDTSVKTKTRKKRKKGRAKYRTASAKKKANKRQYSRRYIILLNYIKLRDQYQCAICDERNIRLDVHHIRKYATHVRIRQNPLNLISVCKNCHDNVLKNRERQFQGMLSRKARFNTRRYKKHPLTYEEIVIAHQKAEKLMPEDFVPFKYKTKEEQMIKKAKEHYLRKTYRGIRHRCYNPKNRSYRRYGARGIEMFEGWKNNYDAFHDWIMKNLGERPKNHSLDRINNDGNYEPGNLKWSSDEEQAQNRSTTMLSQDVVEVMMILFHKYKWKQSEIMYTMDLPNPTLVRNVIRGYTYTNMTYKYLPIIKHEETINRLKIAAEQGGY